MSAGIAAVIALDVGGSSVKSGVVRADGRVQHQAQTPIDSSGAAELIVTTLQSAIERQLQQVERGILRGIAFGFPGPFDYSRGVSYIGDVQKKYEAIYGLDLRAALRPRLGVGDPEVLLSVATENALAEIAFGRLVRQLDRIGAVRLHRDDGDVLPGNHASKTQARLKILELRHGQLRADRIGFGTS